MRLSAYAYPWDFARLGVERMVRQAVDSGVEAIDLAASYHPIDALSPQGGLHFYSDPRGAIYFPARASRYGRIKPSVCASTWSDAWPKTAEHASKSGLGLNAWTITLFSPWIRDAYPECARVSAFGDISGSGLCPANEDVRCFFAALCDDVADQFGVGLFRLENVMPTYDMDWLHRRVLVETPPIARALLNLCFCSTCTERAAARGLDVEALRVSVRRLIEVEIAGEHPDKSGGRSQAIQQDADLQALIESYIDGSTGFVREIGAQLKNNARLSVNASASYGVVLGHARQDVAMSEFFAAADQLALHPGNPNNKNYAGLAAALGVEISALIPLVRAKHSTGPALEGPVAGAKKMARQALELGAAELSLYNMGLLQEGDMASFVRALGPMSAPVDR